MEVKSLKSEKEKDYLRKNLRNHQKLILGHYKEKGETEPHGFTLQKLCTSLEINIEDIVDYGKTEDVGFMKFFHLSVISFLVIPMGNIVIPLILWITKRDKIIGLSTQAIDLINFQILWTIFVNFLVCTYFVNFLNHWFQSTYVLVPLAILYIFNIFYPIRVFILTGKGKLSKYYNPVIRFIK